MNRRIPAWIGTGLILGLGLLHGLAYVFLVPPWQHNDEPNHFEYVWLAAQRTTVPASTDYDADLSRAVVKSMLAHHFYDGLGYMPDLTPGKPVRIDGWSQLGDRPLYYLLASLPLRLMNAVAPQASIESQLYTARLASLAFLLLSLVAACGLARELTPPDNPLRWLAPVILALWPGFIDLMSAVTNIAGAVAFFCLFLWFGARLIRWGLGWLDIFSATVSAAACYWTLSGVYVAIPLLAVAIMFAAFRRRWRRASWVFLFVAVIAGGLAVFSWGDADLWYRETWQRGLTRQESQVAPLGNAFFQLVVPAQRPFAQVYQLIPPANARKLAEKTVTLGAWMWATHPVKVYSPVLKVYNDDRQHTERLTVTETPTFFAITATLASDTSRAWVILSVPNNMDNAGTEVFFDGVVLAAGSYPRDQAPEFVDQKASRGMWGDRPFTNLVRNPSAENAGLRIRFWADKRPLFGSYGRVSMVLYAVRDLPGTWWYFRGTAANLVRTLWGRFGWNHVPLLGHKPYRALLAPTILGLAGAVIGFFRARKYMSWELFTWLGAALLSILALTVARGVFYLWFKPFMPAARYLYPAMVVIVLVLCAGWWQVLRVFEKWLPAWLRAAVVVGFFLGLDIYALISLTSYYG